MHPPRPQLFRVWITVCESWQPRSWHDVPPRSVALEPAEARCLSADDAALYVESFNQALLGQRRDRWAVAVPVTLRYEGDLAPGELVFAPTLSIDEQGN